MVPPTIRPDPVLLLDGAEPASCEFEKLATGYGLPEGYVVHLIGNRRGGDPNAEIRRRIVAHFIDHQFNPVVAQPDGRLPRSPVHFGFPAAVVAVCNSDRGTRPLEPSELAVEDWLLFALHEALAPENEHQKLLISFCKAVTVENHAFRMGEDGWINLGLMLRHFSQVRTSYWQGAAVSGGAPVRVYLDAAGEGAMKKLGDLLGGDLAGRFRAQFNIIPADPEPRAEEGAIRIVISDDEGAPLLAETVRDGVRRIQCRTESFWFALCLALVHGRQGA